MSHAVPGSRAAGYDEICDELIEQIRADGYGILVSARHAHRQARLPRHRHRRRGGPLLLARNRRHRDDARPPRPRRRLRPLTAPVGKTATGDYERFHSGKAQSYLKSYQSTNNPATQRADIVGLEKIVATQLPVIPLFYGVAWDEYSTTHFTGWPSPSNPYAPGEPTSPFDEITLLHLKRVS